LSDYIGVSPDYSWLEKKDEIALQFFFFFYNEILSSTQEVSIQPFKMLYHQTQFDWYLSDILFHLLENYAQLKQFLSVV